MAMEDTSIDGATQVERQVLEIVGSLVAELSGLGSAVARVPKLHDALDRDLGISSLERVELLLRLERAFGVRLPDAVMAEAATPKELVAAILRAAPAAEAPPVPLGPTAPGTPAPASARTLTHVLRLARRADAREGPHSSAPRRRHRDANHLRRTADHRAPGRRRSKDSRRKAAYSNEGTIFR